ncbi:hypothetical protein NMD14_03630 [Aeromonas veronii]
MPNASLTRLWLFDGQQYRQLSLGLSDGIPTPGLHKPRSSRCQPAPSHD